MRKVIVMALLMAVALVTSPGPVTATESGTNSISRFLENSTRGSAFNAMALDPSGNPVVVFTQVRDDGADSLMLLRCNDPDCVGGGDTFTEIVYGSVRAVSIGVRPSTGVPVVAFVGRHDNYASLGFGLHILDLADQFQACAGSTCIDRFPSTVVGKPDATHTSLVVNDTDVYVAYNDQTTSQVRYARCIRSGIETSCESETNPIRSIPDAGLGRGVNLAFTDGGPVPVATLTYNGAGDRVTVARCNDELCTDPTVTSLEAGSEFGSLALDSNGNPVIAYRWRASPSSTTYEVKVVACNDPACGGGDDSATTLYTSSGGNSPGSVALALSRDDLPRVGFNLLTGQLIVVSCSTTTCSDARGEVVQGAFIGDDGEEDWSRNGPGSQTRDLGYYLSMTLDENGWPAMSHVALQASDLWVVRCGSETCVEHPAPPPDCGVGTFSATGVEPCDDAPAGTFVDTEGATEATPCATGTYQPSTGQTSCDPAPAGSFVDIAGATAATLCAAGTFSAGSGAVACTDAPAGSFVDTAGATAATLCATGTYQPSTGQESCVPAPAGTFVDTAGATEATPCATGTYQPSTGQTECDLAPAGTFIDTEGATEATECPAGTFSAASGATACDPAPAGTFIDTTGASQATPCAIGSYQPSTGQTECDLAPVGSFVDTAGATEATECLVGWTTAEAGSVSADDCFPIDTDGDGVPDFDDLCPGTVLPDAPTQGLLRNRFAASIDGFASTDGVVVASLADTGGCSATQIIAELGLGSGHTWFGITRSALQSWIDIVDAA